MSWLLFVVVTFVRLANKIEKGENLYAAEALEFAQWTGLVAMLELYIMQQGHTPLRDGDDGYDVPAVLARYHFLAKRASEEPYVLNAWTEHKHGEAVIMANMSNGSLVELLRYFKDEYYFYAHDFHGHTQREANTIFRNAANGVWGISERNERVPSPMRVQAKLVPQVVGQDVEDLEF